MTPPTSRHAPRERLVPRRPVRGVMPDENMFEQLARLDEQPVAPTLATKPATIDERFDIWIAANPEVLEGFVRLAQQAKDAGRTRIGAKLICEVLRWETLIRGDAEVFGDDAGFKLNNVYVSRLARLAVKQHPDLEDLFAFRRLH